MPPSPVRPQQAGLVLQPGLVDLLVREVRDDPGALPLLSHTLMETWRRREGHTLTVDGYRASGGIHGAVAQSAEQLYAGMAAEQRHLLRDLLLRLVSPGAEGEAGPHPGTSPADRVGRPPRPADRDARRRTAGDQRRRGPRDHPRGAGPGLAAPARLARRRRRGAADPAPPQRCGRRLGHPRASRQRALPRGPAGSRPRLGVPHGHHADRRSSTSSSAPPARPPTPRSRAPQSERARSPG